MTTAAPVAAPAIFDRFTFAFSENGHYGACLRAWDEDLTLESWILTSEQTQCQVVPDVIVDWKTHVLPLDDGRILLFHTGGSNAAHRHELVLLQPANAGSSLHRLGTIPAPWGGHLLPSPNSDQLAFIITFHDLGYSTIWRLPASGGAAESMMQVAGFLTGGVWLDGAALVLGINQSCAGSPSNGITVDLEQGTWKRIWSVSDTSSDQILLYSPHSKLIIVSSTVSGQQRLGWARLGDPVVHFPETLHRPGYQRQALALDDRGGRLLVHEMTGAISRLLVHTPADDRLEVLPSPPGRVSAPASWVGDLIRFRFSTPTHIPALATLRLSPEPEWSVNGGPELGLQPGGPPVELIKLEGRAGPIEAIIYGGPGWRECEHLVVALHGGPLSAWRFQFEPLLHCLSAHGVAVVAPNYRGSTGYGEEHLRTVIGHWGGPDLDDVLDLGKSLHKDRASRQLAEPIVLGVSYGAFLALLAACLEPSSWSGCIALAPFLSGSRLHSNASVAVQHRIDQLGGRRQIEDDRGPRDVLQACAALSAPLLLVHGARDDTIPVQQSRTLRQRLRELGRTEDVDFDYLEVDTDHVGLVRAESREVNQRVIRFCLTRSRAASPRDGKWIKSPTHRRRSDHGEL